MLFTTVVVDGGLDLVTAPQAVQPGRLIACKNYEVARQRGIRRMDGYEKYDGGQSPSTGNSIMAWTTLQTSNPPFGMQVGDAMHYTTGDFADQHGTVFFIDSTGAYPVVYVTLFAPLPYVLASMVGSVGFAFVDDTISNSYNILAAGAGAPAATVFPPQNVLLQAVTRMGGTLLPATYTYEVTALNSIGQTTPSTPVSVVLNFGTAKTTTSAAIVGSNYVWTLSSAGTYAANDVVWITDGHYTFYGQIATVTGGGTILTIPISASTLSSGGTLLPAFLFPMTVNWAGAVIGEWDLAVSPPDTPAVDNYKVYGRTAGDEQFILSTGPINGMTIPFFTDLGTITPVGFPPTANTTGTIGGVLDNLAGNFTVISATIQEVPGQANVNGLFWLKDVLYATRDYVCMAYNTGTNQPNIGDLLFQGASFGAATWTGYLAKLTVTSGSFADSNDAAGLMMFYNTSRANEGRPSGSLAIKNHTQSDVTAATLVAPRVSQAAGLYAAIGGRGTTFATQSWQWCDLGWTIGYKSGSIDFVDMNVALQEVNATTDQHVVTAWKYPTAATGANWNGSSGFHVDRVQVANDGLYSAWTFYTGTPRIPSQSVTLSAFGFTAADIPTNASITGIELQVVVGAVGHTGSYTAGTKVNDLTVQLGPVSQGATPNLAALSSAPLTPVGVAHTLTFPSGPAPQNNPTGEWSSYSFSTVNYGDPAPGLVPKQTLGYSLTPADVLSTSFGVTLAYTLTNTGVQQIQVGLDYVAIRFSYIPQTNFIYFWNVNAPTPTAVKAQVVMHYQQGGDLALTSASGTVYLAFIASNGTVGGLPSRPIGTDEQIRTWPAGGLTPDGGAMDGSLLMALTATTAEMNVMDWSALLTGAPQPDGSTAPASKYQSVTRNFYASSGLDAIYGVSGGGPAFYYDGLKHDASGNVIPGNFSRILTGLPLQFETPRNIEEHQGHIVLGYYSGIIQWSNGANTLSFDPALFDETAGDEGFGERVTGIKSINGDSLCVWLQSRIRMIQGNLNIPAGSQVVSSLYITTLAPTSGGIEYTIQPMANYMYCDFRGITAIGATQKYGDFELGHYSSVIAPWIIPRVQLSSFFEGPNTGIINSVLIRNKNMARFFFADAWTLSMTFLEDNEPPQFTFQQYVASDAVTPLTWDVVQAFTESLGRDRIFGATADNNGWVYELERANCFNGAAITATATLVPDVSQTPYLRKEFRGLNTFGQAQDYALFTLSRSNDYNATQQATGNNVITETFGSLTASPTGNVLPFVSFGTSTLAIEGSAINLRVDSSSDRQFPHLIQAISYTVDSEDERQE